MQEGCLALLSDRAMSTTAAYKSLTPEKVPDPRVSHLNGATLSSVMASHLTPTFFYCFRKGVRLEGQITIRSRVNIKS